MQIGVRQQLEWAYSLTKGYRIRLFVYFVVEFAAIASSLLFVYYSKQAIDQAVGHTSGSLTSSVSYVALSVFLGAAIGLYSSRLNQRIQLQLIVQLQQSIMKKQLQSSWKAMQQWHTGDLLVRMQADVSEIIQMLSTTGPSFLLTGIKLLASFTFLWFMDPMLAFMLVAVSPLFLFSKFFYKKMRRLSQEVKRSDSQVGHFLQENLRFRSLIQALGIHTAREEKLGEAQRQSLQLKFKQLNFMVFTQGMMKLTVNAGYLIAFIWGIYRLQEEVISIGMMTAFLQLVARIQSPIFSLVSFAPAFVRFRTSIERVLAIYQIDQQEEVAVQRSIKPALIRLDQVSFQYEDSPIISALSTSFSSGESVAVVGGSGKGKTTLIRLLLNQLVPDEGNLYIRAIGEEEVELGRSHQSLFAYVPQGNTLFSGSILENIEVASGVLLEESIKKILYLACAEFVYDLPEGIHTIIGESGYGLSEGQAQRIAIARALSRECPIWIFDEASSALDTATTQALLSRLLLAQDDRILIFITHDLTVVEACSQTLYLD